MEGCDSGVEECPDGILAPGIGYRLGVDDGDEDEGPCEGEEDEMCASVKDVGGEGVEGSENYGPETAD